MPDTDFRSTALDWPAEVGHSRALVEGRFGASQLIGWARLVKRVVEIDIEHCPNCGGEWKIITAILEPPVIERIVEHLGLPARAPPQSLARAPMPQAAWSGLS